MSRSAYSPDVERQQSAELNPSLFLAYQAPPFRVKDSVNMGSAYLHFYK